MEDKKKNKLISYVVASAMGAMAAFGIMYWRGIFDATDIDTVLAFISDGFFVVGLLYTGFGVMFYIVNEGILDIIGFGFKSLVYLFTPRRLDREAGGYYEYKIRKKEERAQKPVHFHILWIGVAFILIALLALAVYYMV
ncbi:MAG: DUF3899 domain-containing protein [Clostridia bacterium]|nr:DUF3899 domain-containing protein [Clostridia bacterium]